MKYLSSDFIVSQSGVARFSDHCLSLLESSDDFVEVEVPNTKELVAPDVVHEARRRWPKSRVAICERRVMRRPPSTGGGRICVFHFSSVTVVVCSTESAMIFQLHNDFLHWGDYGQIVHQLELQEEKESLQNWIKQMENAEKRLALVVAEAWF